MLNSIVTPLIILLSMTMGIGYAQDSSVDSPQSAFESYRTASENDDWNSLYSAISPGYRDYMIFESIFALGMDDKNIEANAITTKYVDQTKLEKLYTEFKKRPTTTQTITMYSQAIKNKKGMFLDCLKYFGRKDKQDPDNHKSKFGPLAELVISKNVASAKTTVTSTIVHYSNAGGDTKDIRHETEMTGDIPVYFINSNGKWLFATVVEWQQHNAKSARK